MKEKNDKKNFNILKITKLLTITLAVVLVTLVSFFGVYTQKQNRMENKIKQYSFSMDLKGARMIRLTNNGTKEIKKDSEGNIVEENTVTQNSEESGYTTETVNVNSDDVLNIDNYIKSQEILEKRLRKMGVEEFNIRLNDETGEFVIELAEDDKTDDIVSQLATVGKFEISDSETKEVLLSNEDIKSSEVLYNTTEKGTTVYLQITFDKEGKKKLRDISNEYRSEDTDSSEDTNTTSDSENSEDSGQESDNGENTEENNSNEGENEQNTDKPEENNENSEEKKQKEFVMKIDDEEISTKTFDQEVTTGYIQLSIGQATTDSEQVMKYAESASKVAAILGSGNLPIEYKVEENEYVLSEIEEDDIVKIEIGIAIAVGIAILVLILKHKKAGIFGGIAFVGFVSLFMLLIRYTNVLISMEAILGICLALVINFLFTFLFLNKIKELEKEEKPVEKATKQVYKRFLLVVLPVYLVSISFTFMKWTTISTIGMVMFWGITLGAIYNYVVTKLLFKINMDK